MEDRGWRKLRRVGRAPSSILHVPSSAPLWRLVRYIAVLALSCGVLVGCADRNEPSTRPASLRERTSEAFDDDMPTVSGSEGNKLDRKGIRRDWDRFWDP